MANQRIPKTAAQLDRFEGITKGNVGGEGTRQFVTVTLFKATCGYAHVETHFLRFCWYGLTGRVVDREAYRYSGRNLPRARRIFDREKREVDLVSFDEVYS